MSRAVQTIPRQVERFAPAQPSPHTRARGSDWNLTDIVCHAGPGDRPFEERREHVSIAAVIAGAFTYHGDRGRAHLHPGAILLGNAATCFACSHEHSRGDHCFALQIDVPLFAEIAASAAGSSQFRFERGMLTSGEAPPAWTVGLLTLATLPDPDAAEDLALDLVTAIIAAAARTLSKPVTVSPTDARRISAALQPLEHDNAPHLDLGKLAAVAGMSKFHFLRVFRRVTGLTPYRYLLTQRLDRVARDLSATRRPVSDIAFDAGFGDLSTFGSHFKRHFGVPPTQFRARAGKSAASRQGTGHGRRP